MKITVHIPDGLFEQPKHLAAQENAILEELVAEGLRKVVAGRKARPDFEPAAQSFGGSGLLQEAVESGWTYIRDAIYKGRGT